MRKLISLASLGAVAAVITFTLAPVTVAHANGSAQSGTHCVVEIFTAAERQIPANPICFATEDEVSNYLESMGVSHAGTAARGTAASVVVGTVYKDQGGTGASLTFWGSSGCAGVTFGFPSLASGWNNSISSIRASNGCWVTAYTATSFGSARLNCTPYCAGLNGWNDNVKSLVFRPTGTFG